MSWREIFKFFEEFFRMIHPPIVDEDDVTLIMYSTDEDSIY